MKYLINRGLKPFVLLVVFTALMASSMAFATTYVRDGRRHSEVPGDTTKVDDVVFTSIPTKVDSLKAFKKKQDSLAKAAAKAAAKGPEKPTTLWQIFITGFAGGLLAFFMPCIYPMLPLTVSFLPNAAAAAGKVYYNRCYTAFALFLFTSF